MLGRGKKAPEGARVTALVVEAQAPFDNRVKVGVGTRIVEVLVDAGSGPVLAQREFHLGADQWLVTGMEIPVVIDAAPDDFEVDWDAIPSIEDRVAANDPALVDPVGAQAKVADALKAAKVAPPSTFGRVSADRFKDALATASKEPAPDGKTRAVVYIVSVTTTSTQDDDGERTIKTSGSHRAVLAVTVPGRAPYAVYEPKLKIPSQVFGIVGGGLPALVSTSDPKDVEIDFDALGSMSDQIGQRMANSMEAASTSTADMTAAMEKRIAEAMKNPPTLPEGVPMVPGATAPPGAMSARSLTRDAEDDGRQREARVGERHRSGDAQDAAGPVQARRHHNRGRSQLARLVIGATPRLALARPIQPARGRSPRPPPAGGVWGGGGSPLAAPPRRAGKDGRSSVSGGWGLPESAPRDRYSTLTGVDRGPTERGGWGGVGEEGGWGEWSGGRPGEIPLGSGFYRGFGPLPQSLGRIDPSTLGGARRRRAFSPGWEKDQGRKARSPSCLGRAHPGSGRSFPARPRWGGVRGGEHRLFVFGRVLSCDARTTTQVASTTTTCRRALR